MREHALVQPRVVTWMCSVGQSTTAVLTRYPHCPGHFVNLLDWLEPNGLPPRRPCASGRQWVPRTGLADGNRDGQDRHGHGGGEVHQAPDHRGQRGEVRADAREGQEGGREENTEESKAEGASTRCSPACRRALTGRAGFSGRSTRPWRRRGGEE